MLGHFEAPFTEITCQVVILAILRGFTEDTHITIAFSQELLLVSPIMCYSRLPLHVNIIFHSFLACCSYSQHINVAFSQAEGKGIACNYNNVL